MVCYIAVGKGCAPLVLSLPLIPCSVALPLRPSVTCYRLVLLKGNVSVQTLLRNPVMRIMVAPCNSLFANRTRTWYTFSPSLSEPSST